MEEFEKNDWDHLHDAILTATWNTTRKRSTRKEMEALFETLPQRLQAIAFEWGMNDTEFREGVIEHLKNL